MSLTLAISGRKHNGVIRVDEQDAGLLMDHTWHVAARGKDQLYAETNYVHPDGRRSCILLHRLILSPGPWQHVDHVNHDGLDNRRRNLRLATASQNQGNQRPRPGTSSRFKGVHLRKDTLRWEAYFSRHRKKTYLGCFDSETEAALAYDAAVTQAFGAFALPNFPQEIAS
jgi:hypothetical protein